MKKNNLVKAAVIRFMTVVFLALGGVLLPGSLLNVCAEGTKLPDAGNGVITLTATPDTVTVSASYIDAKGTLHTAQAIPLDDTMTNLGASNKDMWYIVSANTTLDYTETITLAGNVNLILADGAVMNVGTETDRISGSGISGNGKNLTVYGQSNGENAGILKVYNNIINDTNEYGIYMQNGSFIQNSGKVVADHMINGFYENYGGGIYCENFTVNGGSLDAKSKGSNAISVRGDITINGGSVTIRSTNTYALLATNSRITINGGSVNAVSESISAAINGLSVTINGGSVSATNKNTDTNYPNAVMATGGDIILGGSRADDSIFANGYNVNTGYSVKVPEGRALIDDDNDSILYKGTLTPAQIAGKTLRPAYTVTVNIVDSISGKPVEKESRRHGRVKVSPEYFAARDYAGANKIVTLTIAPDTGWELASLKIEKADGSTVEASGAGDSPTFNMPAESVTVSVAFSKIPVTASYVAEDGTSKTVQAIPLDKTMTTLGKPGTGGGIWYVVKENITFDEGITFYYDGTAPSMEEKFSTVNLILEDGCTMSVGTQDEPINGGCVFEEHAVLNIYSQEKGTGALEVFGSGEANAIDLRLLTIYGGKLIAKTKDNTAIYVQGGDLSIHGGNVSVTAEKAAAVGFPENNGEVSGTVLVQGGEFTAESSSEGSGYYTISGGARFFAGNTIIKGPGIREDVELSYNDPGDSVCISNFAPEKEVSIDSSTHKEFTDGTKLYAGVLSDEQKTEIAGKPLYPGCGVSVQIQSQLWGNEVAEADRHGSVTPSKTLFKLSELTSSGQTVTLTIAPQPGYKLSGMQVVGYGPAISTTRVSNTQYTFTMPNESVRVQAVFDTEWKMLEQELNEGGTVTLDQDYTALEGAGPLDVPSDKTVTLDLAGHTIDRGLTSGTAQENGCVIRVAKGGNLTITDSSSGNTGKITGGFNSGNGGGVLVQAGGSFTMTGGQITGNKAAFGGGVYVENDSSANKTGIFNVSGKPVISGNTVNSFANNVQLADHTSITVTGALTKGADIDVTPCGYEKFAAGGSSYAISDDDLAKFSRDGNDTAVARKDTDGKVYFAERELTEDMVSSIAEQAWTGSPIEPSVTVTYGTTMLTKDTHYTVTYSDNTEIGTNTATATITGIYNNSSAPSYYGSVSKSFSIVKATPTVTVLPFAGIITYGQTLADSALTGGKAKDAGGTAVAGTFTWTESSTAPAVSDSNKTKYNATFTPDDTTHYNTASCEITLTVKKRPVTITGLGVSNKEYDGKIAAVVTGTPQIDGVLDADSSNVSVSDGGNAAFEDANAGTGKTVRFSGYSLSGAAADNYVLSAQPENVTADITPKEASLSWTDTSFTYDGREHCPTAAAGNLIEGDTCIVIVTGGQTDVGTHTATADRLSNGNYTLPTEKTTTFTIEKGDAAAPAEITKKYLYSSGGSDSFALTGLPADCGTVIWKDPTTTGSLTYLSGPSVTADGVLSYTVGIGEANSNDTITVIAETDNYKDITITVKVNLADKIPVKPKSGTMVSLERDNLTYGQALSALTFKNAVFVFGDGEEQTVEGTLGWKEPNAKPSVGTTAALAVFTPSGDDYASYEILVPITVDKATPKISTLPTAAGIIYGKLLGDSALTNGQVKAGDDSLIAGTFVWKDPSISPAVSDSDKTEYEVVFTPYDSNYCTLECGVTLTVEKADIPVDSFIAPAEKENLIYSGSAQALITEGHASGGTLWYAVATGDTVPDAKLYTTAIPAASGSGTYTVYYKVVGDANHKNGTSGSVDASIDKLPVTIMANVNAEYGCSVFAKPEEAYNTALADGHTISEITVTGDTSAITGIGVATTTDVTIIDASDIDVTENYDITYVPGTLTVNPARLYICGIAASDKEYDGTSTALYTGTAMLKRVCDDAAVSGVEVSNITVEFIDKNAGAGKAVMITGGTLNDTDHYELKLDNTNEQPTLTATITRKAVTISGVTATNRKYNGEMTVALAGGELTGVLDGDVVLVDLSEAVGTMADANVGSDKPVTVTGVKLGGMDAGNYILKEQPAGVTVTIRNKEIQTITAADVTAVYGDTNKSVSATSDGDGAISYAVRDGSAAYIEVNAVTGALTIKAVPMDGQAYVTVTAAETTSFAQATKVVTINISRANAVAATVDANNRTYDGTEKALVTVTGKAYGGTMQYALGDATGPDQPYTASIPAAIDAGTYYVWYKVAGDDNHTDTQASMVEGVSIAKLKVSVTAADQSVLQNGEVDTSIGKAALDGEVEGHVLASVILTADATATAGDSGKIVPSKAVIKCGDKDVTANYEITYIDGKLTVTAPEKEQGENETPDDQKEPTNPDDQKGAEDEGSIPILAENIHIDMPEDSPISKDAFMGENLEAFAGDVGKSLSSALKDLEESGSEPGSGSGAVAFNPSLTGEEISEYLSKPEELIVSVNSVKSPSLDSQEAREKTATETGLKLMNESFFTTAVEIIISISAKDGTDIGSVKKLERGIDLVFDVSAIMDPAAGGEQDGEMPGSFLILAKHDRDEKWVIAGMGVYDIETNTVSASVKEFSEFAVAADCREVLKMTPAEDLKADEKSADEDLAALVKKNTRVFKTLIDGSSSDEVPADAYILETGSVTRNEGSALIPIDIKVNDGYSESYLVLPGEAVNAEVILTKSPAQETDTPDTGDKTVTVPNSISVNKTIKIKEYVLCYPEKLPCIGQSYAKVLKNTDCVIYMKADDGSRIGVKKVSIKKSEKAGTAKLTGVVFADGKKLGKKDLSGGLDITIEKFICNERNADLSKAVLKKGKVKGIQINTALETGLKSAKPKKIKPKAASYENGVIKINDRDFKGSVKYSFPAK